MSFLFLLDSEHADAQTALAFWQQHQAELPEQAPVRTTDGRLRATLELDAKPITLLLDERLTVRQAFVGTVEYRRSELASAIRRLLTALQTEGPLPSTTSSGVRRGHRNR